MKTLVFIVFLLIVLFAYKYTVEGLDVNIRYTPYGFPFVRKFSYDYPYAIPAIDNGTLDLLADEMNKVQLYYGIIYRKNTNTAANTANIKLYNDQLADNKKRINAIIKSDHTNKYSNNITFIEPIWMTKKSDFDKFIDATKITDLRIIMSVYDLAENVYEENKTKFFTLCIYKNIPLPTTTTTTTPPQKYIRRIKNYPKNIA